MPHTRTPLTYRDAGVDIDAGESLVQRIKPIAAKTNREGVLSGIGGFGGLFQIPSGFKEPVLVSGTDGVGTKLRLAFEWNRHDTVGIDLVAMSVNDILVQGAEPLYFLDYFACGKLSVDVAASVVGGVGTGCKISGCALIGGETAEMPGMYPDGEYDLAGFAVGIVEKNKIITGETINEGDLIIGLGSSGPHSNGYSLIRKIIEISGIKPEDQFGENSSKTFADYIMAPTRIYVKPVLEAIKKFGPSIKGMAHITGGGLTENIPRILKAGLVAQIDKNSWTKPEIFKWLQTQGNVEESEMFRVFNCGIGFVLVVDPKDATSISSFLSDAGELVHQIGRIVSSSGSQVIYA
ncbi:phosphoribosylformylglycinamidine cyclo-ligase [Taylorella equigenitalis]|uniref:Phosphoribosylformylglycinamidine cyclo-ligase n=3 Tax=Taylorella equigenitalis TaxID=29575 RepID=A0A654KFJ9_TAYEM|nr:phosphoribosylformylglycinamidine cyclo-ligase [Taylorella equigenitalis]ADU91207.1 Phosphoribosylformylglycinamidine cyclo-ligase [Taylorella equigenitalis MCE9]AFN36313.1 phosphoribosylformylglycinamidine cyclo-ligase [Taylorella equigenitalis ATCC 35865]ASY30881.1 phosphoribosylformylglycinamidine cyclo-ligase [Taylorella equigenitalis]ASY38186.1 phosphoribosylformylglycinamidine cyclo-ligase [Taylorella equigenitalis]ASY39714.1 phosphoribosylformylglycinamidine cyclo-ligase [Taylorella 